MAGVMATIALGSGMSHANAEGRIACVLNRDGYREDHSTMSSKSGDQAFDEALIVELKRILEVIPVNPGFKYVSDDNAFSRDDSVVGGTAGTVLIGLKLVKGLLKANEGGVAVACVLAHECGHIFQFFSQNQYFDRLNAPTQRLRELHADLLAGYYMAKRMRPTSDALRIVEKAMIDFGSYNNSDPKDHGTPGQRSAALDKGYLLSLNGASFEDAAIEGEKYVRVL
jgi:hypothetical protein